MAWADQTSSNTLATPVNLARVGRPLDLRYSMEGCSAPNTLGHLLSCSKKALDRFNTRHDFVLKHLQDEKNKKNKDGPVYHSVVRCIRVH